MAEGYRREQVEAAEVTNDTIYLRQTSAFSTGLKEQQLDDASLLHTTINIFLHTHPPEIHELEHTKPFTCSTQFPVSHTSAQTFFFFFPTGQLMFLACLFIQPPCWYSVSSCSAHLFILLVYQ